ncbi:hypothetical protein EDC35_103204 [Thiobaca trueperi]|uniref:Uncharacterized protein n=1 Tax=Thiobaca trueperi TaxID=127458 RepID=A0A4R3N2C0_9GAMM|nr:hypothetical protein EDC35_103204 [Thiobaca trueperi]
MGCHLAVGANEFAPTTPGVIHVEAAKPVGANLFAPLPAGIQENFEELGE